MQQKRIKKLETVASRRQRDIIVVLEDVHDPHNAAAILRTCDAMGIQNVWFVFEKEAAYNPKKVGKATSSSANKWLDFRIFESTNACVDGLRQEGYMIIVTALSQRAILLPDYHIPNKKLAVVVGNERDGASESFLQAADTVLAIPMRGFVQSLNVSVAAAIVLWEITRQRNGRFTLLPKDRQKLLDGFLERAKK